MDPLGTNMYLLKRYHPSDSFCTFISESVPCTHDNSNIHHNSDLSAETILSSVQHSQSSDERERGYFNGGPLFMINFIFYITCLVNCCLTRLTNLGIPPKLQCDHVKASDMFRRLDVSCMYMEQTSSSWLRSFGSSARHREQKIVFKR